MSSKQLKKLQFELKIRDGKIHIQSFDQQTKIFLQKSWFKIVEQLIQSPNIQKVSHNFILFNEKLIFKDLKTYMQRLETKLNSISYSICKEVYVKTIKQHLQRILNKKIHIQQENTHQVLKVPYRQFVICYQVAQLTDEMQQKSLEISFDARNSHGFYKPNTKTIIGNGRKRNAFNQHNGEELSNNLVKTSLIIFYQKKNHTKIIQVVNHLQQLCQQWLLYPMSPYLNQFSLDKIYFQELISKIILKKSKELIEIVLQSNLQMIEKTIKLVKDDNLFQNNKEKNTESLQEGYYLGFHVFGQKKNYQPLYKKLNHFFQSRRLWILRPEKICCCNNIIDVEGYLKQKEGLEAFLISNHIVAIVRSSQQMDELTSIRHKQKLKKENIISEQERLTKILQTGIFVLDSNDYDQEDLYYIYKERQGYKKFLLKQYGIVINYTPQTTRLRIHIKCQISAYRIFKGCIFSYINDMKKQKEQLKEFYTPFQKFIFGMYLKPQLEKEYPEIKFITKKRKTIQTIWAKFHAKDRSSLMDRIQQLRRQVQKDFDYIITKKQPISQSWFTLYRRPSTLSIQAMTCRKYILSKDTKVFVMPYQALSRQVDEMLFLIDQSFENCWQFTEIAEQNDINLMSLFLQFQEKRKKKPDRIKSIPLTNHRFINKMVLWYNDMLKKIENRRQHDIKKLYKRYEDKKEMHIMIPRHATTNILLHFVLPSFIKQFTQQTGYALKEIFFYYPILFNDQHCFVEDMSMKIIDEEMKRANIELQNQNFLGKQSIKKIIQMDYVGLRCMFEDDQRIWKATNLAAYVFFIELEILRFKKSQLFQKMKKQSEEVQIPNFKVPLFFMDASFDIQIIVDLREQVFYLITKHTVEGPFKIKSDKKYNQISKCVSCIKTIFRSLYYVVLYVDKSFNVSKNGYYYSHKRFLKQYQNNQREINYETKKADFSTTKGDFKKKKVSLNQKEKTKIQPQKENISKNRKYTVYPMKIEINSIQGRRSHYAQSGKIVKRGSRRLIIEIIEPELVNWYMAETHKSQLPQLEEYLRNPNNYKNNENILLEDISQYSIFNLQEEVQKSRLLDIQQLNDVSQNKTLNEVSVSMESLDLSIIGGSDSIYSESISKISILKQMQYSFSMSNQSVA